MRGNALQVLALCAWPAIAIATYALRRRTARVARTTAWMLILPIMFLPALDELPFAGLDKNRLPLMSIAVALALLHARELATRAPLQGFPLVVLGVLVVGVIGTMRTNGDELWFGPLRTPGLTWRDGAWMVYHAGIDLFLPFAIGQRVFRTEKALTDLLDVLSICSLIYIPLCLIEMRLSPQLHTWVYGYFPSAFSENRRGAGFRPVVFMNHGLHVAAFLFSGFAAALALRKAGVTTRPSAASRVLVLGALLAFGHSLASILYSGVALALHAVRSTTIVARSVLLIAVLVAAYPAIRASQLFPTHTIGELVGSVSKERMQSLMFRLRNEELLLARASERPLFGWGGWSRNRVLVSWGAPGDYWAGHKDVSVTDGAWIIVLGISGIVGLTGFFSLFLVPLVRFARTYPYIRARSCFMLGMLAVIVALSAVDLLPNGQSDYLALACAGALFTLSQSLTATQGTGGQRWPKPIPPDAARQGPVLPLRTR